MCLENSPSMSMASDASIQVQFNALFKIKEHPQRRGRTHTQRFMTDLTGAMYIPCQLLDGKERHYVQVMKAQPRKTETFKTLVRAWLFSQDGRS